MSALDIQRLTLEKGSIPVFWVRSDASLFYVNEAACKSLRYTREELLQLRIRDIDPLFPEDRWKSHWDEVAKRGFDRFETVHRTKDGREFPVEIQATYVEHEGEGYHCAFSLDITERRRAERTMSGRNRLLERLALGGSLEEVLEILIETVEQVRPSITACVLLLDADRQHLTNGVAPSLPPFFTAALDPVPVGPGVGCCGAAAHTGQRVIVPDIRTHPNWAAFRDVAERAELRSCWSEPIRSSRNEILGTFSCYYPEPREPDDEDISFLVTSAHLAGIAIERKRTEAALEAARNAALEAARLKTEFLANVSHEIRTPMTAILGFADHLVQELAEADGSEELRRNLGTILRNAEHLLAVINDILDLSRIEAGQLQVRPQTCSPVEIAADVLRLLEARAFEKGLELRAEFDGPVPETIQSDPTRVRQILINLVGNAIKFTHEGSVVMRMGHRDEQLWVDVVDSGIGLRPEDCDHIFDSFTQADSSTTRHYGGTGLGLTISRRLARMLGGEVDVTSELGVGSRFQLTLCTGSLERVAMLDAPDISAIAATPSERAQRPQLTGRVLLAEDGPDNQRLIRLILERAGLEVALAEDGEQALNAALAASEAGAPFDLILMDVQMPHLDGYQATAQLRGAGCDRPIIALTAHAMAGEREKALRAGADDYATKPIQAEQLLRLMAAHLPKPR